MKMILWRGLIVPENCRMTTLWQPSPAQLWKNLRTTLNILVRIVSLPQSQTPITNIRPSRREIQAVTVTLRLVVDLFCLEHLLRRLIIPRIERVIYRMSVVYQRPREPTPSFCRHFQMASFQVAQTPIGVMERPTQVAVLARTEEARGQDGRE